MSYYRILKLQDYIAMHIEVIDETVKNTKIPYAFDLSQNFKNFVLVTTSFAAAEVILRSDEGDSE